MSKTVVKIEDSKYGKLFGVYSHLGTTAEGEAIMSPNALSGKFGLKKAKAILGHVEELKEFVEKEEADGKF